jgi:hypothetical protein
MGTIDCITTVIGTAYFGASELNPFLSGIVGNIPLFMILKLAATGCIAGTYVLSRKILSQAQDKTTRSFRYSDFGIKIVYAGLVLFLVVVVVNNLIVLFA